MKYTFSGKDEDLKLSITYEIEAVGLNELLPAFEDFLRGCGFSFSGQLQFLDDTLDTEELELKNSGRVDESF